MMTGVFTFFANWAAEFWDEFAYVPIGIGVALLAAPWVRRWLRGGRCGEWAVPARLPLPAIVALAVVPVVYWFGSIRASVATPAAFLRFTDEDGALENIQELLLIASVVLSVLTARVCLRRGYRFWGWSYVLLAVALFWAAGEEISWGQRILNVATPEWFATHNVQQELNLHNLGDTDDRLSDAADLGLALLTLGSAALGLLGVYRVKRLHASLWLPPASLLPSLGCVLSFGPLLSVFAPDGDSSSLARPVLQLQEVRESVLYGAIAIFLWLAWHHAKTLGAGTPPPPRAAADVQSEPAAQSTPAP